MNKPTIGELYNKLTELVEAGDENVVRKFIVDHIKDFPEDLQKKIAFDFFEEALQNKNQSDEKIAQIQKEAVETLEEIDSAEKGLTEADKIADVKSGLGI